MREVITKHGGYRTAEYKVWHSMLVRCSNPNDAAFADYGGRGIRVCDRWLAFAAFRDDMGPRPSSGTLERDDVNGHYEPSNCRWATPLEQANNRRNNHVIEHDGHRLTVAQWARVAGLSKSCLLYRIAHGWTLADALVAPSDRRTSNRLTKALPR